jgi:disulfide oxidoreductase YuzD
MYLNFNIEKVQIEEFKHQLQWFEHEFDEIFQNNSEDKLSESINQCKDEKLLYDLVSTLNSIEKKHPELF